MKTKTKSGTKQSLAGVRVLVGRARHQAGALSAELRKHGAQVIEIPFIEIRKPRSFRPMDSALKHLDTYDWLILTSVNGVEAMWDRLQKLRLSTNNGRLLIQHREGHEFTRTSKGQHRITAPALEGRLRIAAIGPATKNALEQRGLKVDVMPKEYVAESVVRSLRGKVRAKRVVLVRAKVARDVIPRELRNAGAQVDVLEAYETVVPESSRRRLRTALNNREKRPNVVTFTSSSTVRNFVELLGKSANSKMLDGVLTASIGPVTSGTLRELGLAVNIQAKEFTIPGLVTAIVDAIASRRAAHP